MGRWATYMIGREHEDPPAAYARHSKTVPGWVWWELPLARGGDWDPGPGHAVVAHIFDSDVADISGLVAGERAWRWVYGEATLAAFEERPVDALELEDSLPGRAEETTHLIQAWAMEAGLPEVDAPALAAILQCGYTFAEEGVREVLEALGIVADDSAVEHQDLDPTVDADGRPFGEPRPTEPSPGGPTMAGVLAAAIDHSSDAWRGLVAEFWLDTFGEPPALVALDGTVFVAFDPPIMLSSYGRDTERTWVSEHLGVDWVEVPSQYAGGLLEAVAWARANVGVQGRPADEHRLRLNVEVSPDYLDGLAARDDFADHTRSQGWQHSIADPLHVGIELAMGADLLARVDEVADWLDHARDLLLTPVTAAYAERGGTVHLGDGAVPGYALVPTLVYKSARGRHANAAADDKAWRRVQRRLRAGELTSIKVTCGVANGFGQMRGIDPWGDLLIGAQLAADQRLYSLPAHLTVKISDPLRSFVPGPFVGELVGRAVETLPVVGGWVDAARRLYLGDGQSRYESLAGTSSLVRRDPRTSVRGPAWRILLGPEHLRLLGGRGALEASGVFTEFSEVGQLLMVQCGDQPVDCTWERRDAMVGVLASVLPPKPDR
ncbi:DUF3396 domain-containing protein [Kribbella shirazensis]|uniref:Uncharacterized protein n=1 Tax=Kribbella shirazensis TaxID=1105143 RepID=A0A7X6A5C6_9ACTN|nr:DUF3396 domain-containing protein [Kribbella shirazensis]NIK61129.1 hypothetical protein [Kribbella shirazensis]